MKKVHLIVVVIFLFGGAGSAFSQVEGPLLNFRRGMLWNSYHYSKTCVTFASWTRKSYGLDWPGYDPEWVGVNVGGYTSYITTGGIWFTAKTDSGRVISVDDWSMYGGSVDKQSQNQRYRVLKHTKKYPDGANYYLRINPNDAEDVIESAWERNPLHAPMFQGDTGMPITVRRNARQWSGSQREENYIIIEYVIKNSSPSQTLNGAYAMLSYSLAANYRGWNRMAPGLTQGSRNNQYFFDVSPARKNMMYSYAEEAPSVLPTLKKYDYYDKGGPDGQGEYLAPGYPGFKLLYSTPDTIRNTPTTLNRIGPTQQGYAWAVAPDEYDNYGPLGTASGGWDRSWGILKDPTTATDVVTSPGDPRMKTKKMWSMVSLGPWTLHPGDSVVIAYAEFVAGPPYELAVNPTATPARIGQEALKQLANISARAQFAYDNHYHIPHPPAAPDYYISLSNDPRKVANIIDWPDSTESILDQDYSAAEANDLAGYRIYKSSYLPLGPWKLVQDIRRGNPEFYHDHRYTYVDTAVAIGMSYYYAVTAYDTGHASWPPNPAYRFPETGSNRVPPLETSIYASLYSRSSLDPNYVVTPFRTMIPAASTMDNILVVPNPFVLQSGSTIPQDYNFIQFINVPSPCTIRIYTMRGDLVKTIEHNDGSGIVLWNQQTDYGQFVGSGVYVFHIDAGAYGTKIGKLAIVR